MSKVRIVFSFFLTAVLIGIAMNTSDVLAEELTNKPTVVGTPAQSTAANLIYPGGNGVEDVEFVLTIRDVEPESVGGDVKTVINGKEYIHQDVYQKTAAGFQQRVTAKMPSEHLKPGINDVQVTVISHNEDGTKSAESISYNLRITKYQRYEVEYRDQRTNQKIEVPQANFPVELINAVGINFRTTPTGTQTITTDVAGEWYSFDQAYLGTNPLKRANTYTILYFDLIMGDEPEGNTVTVYYELDIPEYYSQRTKELNDQFDNQKTNPMVKRTVSNKGALPYQQKILFGPINGLTDEATPFPEANVLGNGTSYNPGNFYLNILNEYTTNSYAMSQTSANAYNGKLGGLSLNVGGVNTANATLYLDPRHTEYYTSTNKDGDEVITILSLSKPNATNINHKERYVIEYTAVIKQGTSDVDITVEVTNGSGEERDISVMYQTPLQLVGNMHGTTIATNVYQPIRALGNNKGVYVETDGPIATHYTRASLVFPDVADNGPESWLVGARNIDNYNGFNRGGTLNTTQGKGFETGYTLAESTAAGNPALVGTPYPEDYQLGSGANNAVRFKSPLTKTNPNESVKMSWTMSFGDGKYEKPEDSIYREMDKESGEDLADFDYVDKLVPVEIDTSKIDEATDVVNYLVFGTQAGADTQTIMQGSKRSNLSSHIFAPYRNENVPFTLPRVITYKKGAMNTNPTSYSYDWNSGANSTAYSGSGFGIATFDDHKTQNPVPADLTKATKVEEVYLSKDRKVIKVYGQYTFNKGANGQTETIPMKITAESSNNKGKARFTLEYMNTMSYTTDFRSFYSVHMDINGKHESSKMRTLGGDKGVYFKQSAADSTERVAQLGGADYYVAFYTSNTNEGVEPNDLNVYSFDRDVANGQTGTTAPLGWQNIGQDEFRNLGRFDKSQPRGEEFLNREIGTGKLLPRKPAHPGWHFVYPTTTLAEGKVGRADLEMKVTDLPEIEYQPVEIQPEENKVANHKSELTYAPKLIQEMKVELKAEEHRPDNVQIVGTFMPYLENVTASDFSVLQKDGTELDKALYDLKVDQAKGLVTLTFMDPAPKDLVKETLSIEQNSKIRTDKDSKGITTYYDKAKGQFNFPIEAYNSWEIHDDVSEPRVTQDPTSKDVQVVSYRPKFGAKAITGKTVSVGDDAGDAKDYLQAINEPDFAFDKYEVTFKNGVKPEFKVDGEQTVTITVTSKEFGNSEDIPVKVTVNSEVNMTVKYILTNKDKTESKLKDLTDDNLPEIEVSQPVKINAADNIKTIIKDLEGAEKLGYDHYKTTVKVGNQTSNAADVITVPKEDFTVQLYYTGKVMLDYPDKFDFGQHKLSVLRKNEVRPKITKDKSDADDKIKMRVINTQGKGGIWDLYAQESKRMTLTKPDGQKEAYKGQIYYIPAVGEAPIVFGEEGKIIESDAGNPEDIMNVVPFLPTELKTKSGLYMDVFQGNGRGEYIDGEITWELRSAR